MSSSIIPDRSFLESYASSKLNHRIEEQLRRVDEADRRARDLERNIKRSTTANGNDDDDDLGKRRLIRLSQVREKEKLMALQKTKTFESERLTASERVAMELKRDIQKAMQEEQRLREEQRLMRNEPRSQQRRPSMASVATAPLFPRDAADTSEDRSPPPRFNRRPPKDQSFLSSSAKTSHRDSVLASPPTPPPVSRLKEDYFVKTSARANGGSPSPSGTRTNSPVKLPAAAPVSSSGRAGAAVASPSYHIARLASPNSRFPPHESISHQDKVPLLLELERRVRKSHQALNAISEDLISRHSLAGNGISNFHHPRVLPSKPSVAAMYQRGPKQIELRTDDVIVLKEDGFISVPVNKAKVAVPHRHSSSTFWPSERHQNIEDDDSTFPSSAWFSLPEEELTSTSSFSEDDSYSPNLASASISSSTMATTSLSADKRPTIAGLLPSVALPALNPSPSRQQVEQVKTHIRSARKLLLDAEASADEDSSESTISPKELSSISRISSETLHRLQAGIRPHLSPNEIRTQTERRYAKLPEVEERRKEQILKQEAEQRRVAVKELDARRKAALLAHANARVPFVAAAANPTRNNIRAIRSPSPRIGSLVEGRSLFG